VPAEPKNDAVVRARICIYVPAYNVATMLAKVLDGIMAQTAKPDEILVIDDGSSDNPAAIVEHYPAVTLIRHVVNKGLAAGRNTAFSSTQCEFVGSLDGDVIAAPDWVGETAGGDRRSQGCNGWRAAD